jgi:hypothetical protein
MSETAAMTGAAGAGGAADDPRGTTGDAGGGAPRPSAAVWPATKASPVTPCPALSSPAVASATSRSVLRAARIRASAELFAAGVEVGDRGTRFRGDEGETATEDDDDKEEEEEGAWCDREVSFMCITRSREAFILVRREAGDAPAVTLDLCVWGSRRAVRIVSWSSSEVFFK